MDIHFEETKFGFEWGAAKFTRLFDDDKKGWVTVGLKTPKYKQDIQIYITKSGKVRIFSEVGEWLPTGLKVLEKNGSGALTAMVAAGAKVHPLGSA